MAPVTLFTQIINREIPAEIVYEDDGTIVFMDINPATRGHMLVVPKHQPKISTKSRLRTLPSALASPS